MAGCTARRALGHMIMPMNCAPDAAASSASSAHTMPHIFSSVSGRLLLGLVLLLRNDASVAVLAALLHACGRLWCHRCLHQANLQK